MTASEGPRSVHLQLPADLLARVDKAAGDIPRNRWIRRAIERALDAQPEFVPASTHNALAEAARSPAPTKRPQSRREEILERTRRKHAPNCKCPVCAL